MIKLEKCPVCNGTGIVKKGFISKQEIQCKNCNGSGYADAFDQTRRIKEIRAKLMEAKFSGADISETTLKVREAVEANKNNEFRKAKELLDEAESMLSKQII
jgi:RecJ-like exonuclease